MKNEELMAQVSALQIQPGTIVVLSLNLDADNFPAAQDMAEQLRMAVPPENKLLVLQRPVEIQALDEAQMREFGWVRYSVVDELVAAMEPVITISDRKHDAWDRAKEVIASVKGG